MGAGRWRAGTAGRGGPSAARPGLLRSVAHAPKRRPHVGGTWASRSLEFPAVEGLKWILVGKAKQRLAGPAALTPDLSCTSSSEICGRPVDSLGPREGPLPSEPPRLGLGPSRLLLVVVRPPLRLGVSAARTTSAAARPRRCCCCCRRDCAVSPGAWQTAREAVASDMGAGRLLCRGAGCGQRE